MDDPPVAEPKLIERHLQRVTQRLIAAGVFLQPETPRTRTMATLCVSAATFRLNSVFARSPELFMLDTCRRGDPQGPPFWPCTAAHAGNAGDSRPVALQWTRSRHETKRRTQPKPTRV